MLSVFLTGYKKSFLAMVYTWTEYPTHSSNILGKGINPTIHPPAMGKYGRVGILNLV